MRKIDESWVTKHARWIDVQTPPPAFKTGILFTQLRPMLICNPFT